MENQAPVKNVTSFVHDEKKKNRWISSAEQNTKNRLDAIVYQWQLDAQKANKKKKNTKSWFVKPKVEPAT